MKLTERDILRALLDGAITLEEAGFFYDGPAEGGVLGGVKKAAQNFTDYGNPRGDAYTDEEYENWADTKRGKRPNVMPPEGVTIKDILPEYRRWFIDPNNLQAGTKYPCPDGWVQNQAGNSPKEGQWFPAHIRP